MIRFLPLLVASLFILSTSCQNDTESSNTTDQSETSQLNGDSLVAQYARFTLTTDVSALSEAHKKAIPILIEAAKIMDTLFMWQAYGDPSEMANLGPTPALQRYVEINYGPWDRLNGNEPFLSGVGPKPEGANYYPVGMTKAEFEQAELEGKDDLYTFVRRNDEGNLTTIAYHERFSAQVNRAADLLEQAAGIVENEGLQNYLAHRASALRNDDYFESDLAWLDMKTNTLDVVIGPIETYEDQLFGYKASYEAYVLVKDQAWSDRLSKYATFLPWLQEELPVDPEYKQEKPGTDSDLNAYDVVYYAGDCNAGSKTIAINLPNDEDVQLQKGTRRLQLKNAMQAKFDKILVPIADLMITEDQRSHITFDAFFGNTMFHEVAHGLGIKNTINDKGTVRNALKEHSSGIEEGKADILGVYMITKLHERGELGQVDLLDYYVTFMAGIFRSIRFGSSSAHGVANLIRFNYFNEMGAFEEVDGRYRVNQAKFQQAITALSNKILTLQGDGDYKGTQAFLDKYAVVGEQLQGDLDQINGEGIPVDIVFNQGVDVLGL